MIELRLSVRTLRRAALAALLALGAAVALAGTGGGSGPCDEAPPEWLACEDFEDGGLGWAAWFAQSPWVECLGCRDGANDPARLRLVDNPAVAHTGRWSLYLPAEASAGYQGASLTWRSCEGAKRPGCRLAGYEALYFRAWVKLADDHAYVHHFLEVAGTRPDAYWESDGNAGCRPNGTRWAGTTLDFNRQRELFFYTYFPEMRCDRGGYCSGDYARSICAGCAQKAMPCPSQPECCWGNHFGPDPAVTLARGPWVCLEVGMRLNTPGQADGRMAFWVDGLLAHEQTGMRWRDAAELQLNKAWLQHYIAAGDAGQSNRIWFDDVVVSTQRIGCGGAPPEAPTATTTAVPAPSGTPTETMASPTPAPTAAPTSRPLALPWAARSG